MRAKGLFDLVGRLDESVEMLIVRVQDQGLRGDIARMRGDRTKGQR